MLNEKLQSCTLCQLHKSCKSVGVPGRGSSKPRVIFVGQAPGAQEDRKGKCFVGPAGQLLIQAIKQYKMERPYITNLVKCAPPGDRDPLAGEIKTCSAYLEEELEAYGPEFVVTLGNIATRYFLGNSSISKVAGRLHKVKGRTFQVFPIFHPSYTLRYPANLPEFERQFKRLQNELGPNHKTKKEKFLPPVSLKEADALLAIARNAGKLVVFDYETDGITKTSTGRVRCVSFATGRDKFWVRADTPGFEEWIKNWLRSDIKKGAQNASFERRASFINFGVWPARLQDDPMAQHYLLDENSSHALDNMAETILGAEPWSIEPEDWATEDINRLGDYCAEDAYQTWELIDYFEKQMSPKIKKVYRDMLIPLGRECAFIEENGMYVDKKWCATVVEKFEAEQKELVKAFMTKRVRKVLDPNKVLNINSHDQVRPVFLQALGLPLREKTDGGAFSVRAEALEPHKRKHPEVRAYLDWKERQTLIANYLKKFPEWTDEQSLVHPSMGTCFVVTGRLSVTSPNAQAIPRNPWVRGMMRSRWKHGKILSLDYKQLEMRLAASEAGETKLIKAINKGEDVHDFTARQLFGKDFTKEQRDIAKQINFLTIYGGSEYKLASDFGMSIQEATEHLDHFHKVYANIFRWMTKKHDEAKQQGWIESMFGRRRRFPDTSKMPDWQKARIERQGGNFPIQSAGADLTNLSVIEVGKFLRTSGVKSLLIMQVHDSLLIDFHPDDDEKEIIKTAKLIMEKRVPAHLPSLKVPLRVDTESGKRWAEWELKKEKNA